MLIQSAPPHAHILLSLISADGAATGLVEYRYRDRTTRAWRQEFRPAGEVGAAPDVTRHDIFVGCVPRLHASGRRNAMAAGGALWVDCDDEASVATLASFAVPPSLVVASGSTGHRHAYWRLPHLLSPQMIERGNRRLAITLGSDPAVAHANAIMRLPGSLNHKTDPPRQVSVLVQRPGNVELGVLLRACRNLPSERGHRPLPPRRTSPLAAVPPEEYVRVLLGVEVPPSRKVRCPGPHADRTPSLHVYPTVERGWFCFGCRRGGTLYDLAGLVFGLSPRGESFAEIDRRLRELWRCDTH